MQKGMRQSFASRATYWLKVVSLGLVLGTGLQFASAWTAPTAAPPGGNVAGPVTTGSAPQFKDGSLGLSGDLVIGAVGAASRRICLNGTCITSWPTGGGGGNIAGCFAGGGNGCVSATLSCYGLDSKGQCPAGTTKEMGASFSYSNSCTDAGGWLEPFMCIPNGGGASVIGDNLGNHTATQNLAMGGFNVSNAANVYANQFFDNNNAGYYVDPNGASILNTLGIVGKATSAATAATDSETTLTTKGYVDSKVASGGSGSVVAGCGSPNIAFASGGGCGTLYSCWGGATINYSCSSGAESGCYATSASCPAGSTIQHTGVYRIFDCGGDSLSSYNGRSFICVK